MRPAGPIIDAELVNLEPDRTDLAPKLNAEQGDGVGRRTYTIRDFKRP